MAQSNVRVLGTSATQAAIAYTAPNGSACSVALSQTADINGNPLAPLAHDIDTSIFPAANMDNRAGSLATGQGRVFVAGQRIAQTGANGYYYSRALQANTLYYGAIVCGSTTAHFNFQTANVPLGVGYGDPWPTDPNNPGWWASPSSPGSIANEQFIEPQTGLQVQRLTYPGYGYSTGTQPLSTAYDQAQNPCDTAGPWLSPCNAVGSSGYASVSNSTGWLVLRPNTITSGWGDGQTCNGDSAGDFTDPTCGPYIQQLQVSITGYCTSANSALCRIGVALSMNAGASAATSVATATLPFTTPTTPGTVTVGAHSPGAMGIDSWIFASNPKIRLPDAFQHTGNVSVSGPVVALSSGDWFNPTWTSGGSGRIRLSNISTSDACNASSSSSVEVSVASGSGNSITLTSSPGSYAYYCGQDFSVMISRLTADTSTSVFIQNVSVSYITDTPGEWPDAGFQTICAHNSVGAGFLCEIAIGGGGAQLSWINPANGTTNVIGPMTANAKSSGANQWNYSGGNPPCPLFSPEIYIAIDDTQPTPTWYCIVTDTANKLAMLKVQYTGSYSTSNNYANGSGIGTGALVTSDDYSLTYSNAVITDLTPSSLSKDLGTLLTNYIGGPLDIPGGVGGLSCSNASVQQGNFLIYCFLGQNTMGWLFVISPGDGIPTHAGGAGAHVIASLNTWQNAASRFGVNHSTQDYGQVSGYVGYGPDPMFPGNNALGNTTVINTFNTSLPAAGTNCAAWSNPLGIKGNNCIQIQINANGGSYEPYYWMPVAAQGQTPGVPATAQPGDTVCVSESLTSCNWLNLAQEYMMLLQKGVGSDPSQWVFRRGPFARTLADANLKYLFFLPSSFSNVAGAPGWGGMYSAYPGYIPSPIFGNNVIWSYQTDALGQNPFTDIEGECGHGFLRPTEAACAAGLPYSPFTGVYNVRRAANFQAVVSAPIGLVSANPYFQGILGPTVANVYQSHPGPSGDNATWYEGQAAFDVRPLVGTATSTPGSPSALTNIPGTTIWLTTYSGATYTDADDFGPVNRKIYATAASSGPHPLVDVSGPVSNVATCAYCYCIPRVSGECHTGSTVGQIYVNAPGVIYPWCYGDPVSGQSNPQTNDICIGNASPVGQGGGQLSTLQSDPLAGFQRVLVRVMNGQIKQTSGFANIHMLPDNSWAMFQGNYLDGLSRNDYMARMPPFPPSDSVARSVFVPVPIAVKPPAGAGVNNAIVQFGYQEYNGNCTTRNEPCIANAATIGSVPFLFASENPAGLACSAGCTIAVPAISQRVLYYKVEYRNASNNVLSVTPSQVLVAP